MNSSAQPDSVFAAFAAGAVDVSDMDGTTAAENAVNKDLFLDMVSVLTANGISTTQIPAKLEGLAFGQDVNWNGNTVHTLWVANDNDFELEVDDGSGTITNIPNPNQFFVFGFTDADLNCSQYLPQQFK
jgi:Esterase-like activity of phytase